MEVTRSDRRVYERLEHALNELSGKIAKVGWLGGKNYEAKNGKGGVPVATIAAQNEFGNTINHPGGTPYKIGPDGLAVFVSLDTPGAENLPKTKPHQIVIPPRPFMRPTIAARKAEWFKQLGQGAKAILAGNETAESVLQKVSAGAAGDVRKTISTLTSPPLAKSTIRARVRSMSNNSVVGSLDKPLVRDGIMLTSCINSVEDAGGELDDSGQ